MNTEATLRVLASRATSDEAVGAAIAFALVRGLLLILAAARGPIGGGAFPASLVRRHSRVGVLRGDQFLISVHVCLCRVGQRWIGVLINVAFGSIRAFAELVLPGFLRLVMFCGAHLDS